MPRRHERSLVRKEISLRSVSGERETLISNVSLGGCFVESISIYRPGDDVEFDLHNEAGQVLHFTGTIAHVLEGRGFGLTFTNLAPEHLAFLEAALAVNRGAVV